MKRQLLGLAAVASLATPSVLARTANAETLDAEEAAAKSGGSDDAEAKADGHKFVPNAPPADAPLPKVDKTHMVEKGDTLWDLSQKYLGNPWYWPKVWSLNSQIANPHWIYPGNEVRFFGEGGAPADGEAPAGLDPVAEGEDESMLGADDNGPVVSSSRKIGYVTPKTSTFRQDGFITDRELEENGQLSKSFAETEMLREGDIVYAKFKTQSEAEKDRKFFIYKTVRDLKHPISNAKVGYLTHIVGILRVTGRVQDGTTSAVIERNFDEVNRGDFLAPYSEKLNKQVSPRKSAQKVEGYVVDTMLGVTTIGQGNVVFVDKGKKDGLEEGHLLKVYRRMDGAAAGLAKPGEPNYEDTKLPIEVIGTMMVIDAKDSASTCVVVSAAREFVIADKWTTQEAPPAASAPVSMR